MKRIIRLKAERDSNRLDVTIAFTSNGELARDEVSALVTTAAKIFLVNLGKLPYVDFDMTEAKIQK